jgi:hypothetical protein
MSAPATESGKKYDVAISFLIEDVSLAQALYDKLSEGFEVFFSPRRQEELAGTNGAESMREPFLSQSRINLIVYREKWGNTPWTGVEAAAILDSCVRNQFKNAFLFVVEESTAFPAWLPYNHMRFNYGEYTIDHAVGAIKLRVQEQGGQYAPLTPLKKAQMLKAEEAYRWDKSRLTSHEGIESMLGQVDELVREMERQCIAVNTESALDIEHEISPRQHCILRHHQIGMIVRWEQQYEGGMQKGGLSVEEYYGHLYLNREIQGNRVHFRPPERLNQTFYDPDLSRAREYGWTKRGKGGEFIYSTSLAEKLVLQFLNLIERAASGKLRS